MISWWSFVPFFFFLTGVWTLPTSSHWSPAQLHHAPEGGPELALALLPRSCQPTCWEKHQHNVALPITSKCHGWPSLMQVHRHPNSLSFPQQVHAVPQLFLGCKASVCPLVLFVSQRLQFSLPSACFFHILSSPCLQLGCSRAVAAEPGATVFPLPAESTVCSRGLTHNKKPALR